MKNKKRVFEVSFVVSMSLFLTSYAVYNVAMANKAQINKTLNITNSNSTGTGNQYYTREYTDDASLKTHLQDISEKVEGEGAVLLKNNNQALPLSQGDKVSCFFNGSVNFNYSTSGSSQANTSGYKNLKEALTNSGLEVNSSLWDYLTNDLSKFKRTTKGQNYKVNESGISEYTSDVLATLLEYQNIIVTISRDSGEGKDINLRNAETKDGSYLSLSVQEEEVLKSLTALKQSRKIKKIIVLLNSSQMVQTDFLQEEDIDVDALLWVGNVGSYGIQAVTDIIAGKVNPSGKLSQTMCNDNLSSPAAKSWSLNQGMTYASVYGNSSSLSDTQKYYGVNVEGIYVGYRYYETRYYDYVTLQTNVGDYSYSHDVSYPFGYGISYSDFSYSNYQIENNDNGYLLSLDVTNTSSVKGKNTVEIYLSKPYTEYDKTNKIEKSSVELVGYGKTGMLAPQQTETVKIKIDKSQLKSYDANKSKTYILEDGNYQLIAANDSHEATNNLLAKEGKTPSSTSNRMDSLGQADLVKTIEINSFDDQTYSVSTHTGKTITNLFDESDINKSSIAGDNKVTYVSRHDWEGSYPQSSVSLTANNQIISALESNKSFSETETNMPTYSAKNNLTLASLRSSKENEIPYDDKKWDSLLDEMTFEEQAELLTTAQFQTVAIPSISKPATSEDDGPTGISSTKTGTSFPSEGIWASTFNIDLIEELSKAFAEDVLAANRTGIYASGVNIQRTPFGGRNHEYFSEDPILAGYSSKAEIKGFQEKGVITHVKHLAFNEEECNRNGISIWLNEQEAREIMLVPFEYSLSADEGNSQAAMSSFNRIGTTWAGADNNLQNNLLRDEWGFNGYIITDMASSNGASYMTYQDGFLNGTSCFLGSGSSSALNEFKNSPTFATKMREATHHILYAVCNYSYSMNGLGEGDSISTSMPWWQTTLIVIESAFGASTLITLGLYVFFFFQEHKAS
jgi:beta-glucosidase